MVDWVYVGVMLGILGSVLIWRWIAGSARFPPGLRIAAMVMAVVSLLVFILGTVTISRWNP